MSKTPYEIRFDLLQMTTNHLTNQYHANAEFAKSLIDKALSQNTFTGAPKTAEQVKQWAEQMQEQFQGFMPVPPTIAEIMEKAAELYTFVGKKD